MNLKKEINIAAICEPNCKSLLSIINNLIADIQGLSSEFKVNVYYILNDFKINYCVICKNCFKTSVCCQDAIDHFDIAKQIIIDSDLIIIGSPVLGNNVSGVIKTFIDRTSYWMHLMNLLGKTAVVCVSAKNTGYDNVVKYLYEVCSNFGLTVIGVICKTNMTNVRELKAQQEIIIRNFMDIYLFGFKVLGNTYLREKYKMYYSNFAWLPLDRVTSENQYWVKRKSYSNLDVFLDSLYR